MKITMTNTIQGSLDGLSVRELSEGEQYDTVDSARGDRLARYHVKNGNAVIAPIAAPAEESKPVSIKRGQKGDKWTE